MAINNPYIPGDPYSYDLKWFIQQLKDLKQQMESIWETLDEKAQTVLTDLFNSVDFEALTDEKIEEMYNDGTLKTIVDQLFVDYQTALDVLSARMDTFSNLPNQSTAGDAELADIRVWWNGNTSANAGDAVRGQITEVYDDYSYSGTFSASQFSHYYIDNTGAELISQNRIMTVDYLDKNIISIKTSNNLKIAMRAYDQNDTYVGYWNGSAFVITDGSFWLDEIDFHELERYGYKYKIAVQKADLSSIATSSASDLTYRTSTDNNARKTPDSYVWDGVEYMNAQTILDMSKIYGFVYRPGNLVDPAKCVKNKVVSWNNGLVNAQNGYFITGYIPVEPSTVYKLNYGRNISWYNSDHVYIDGVGGSYAGATVTSPASAAYVRYNINMTSDGITKPIDLYFAKTSEYMNIPVLPNQDSKWAGKTISWLGDSIVADNDFDELVADGLGMTLFDHGINGATIAYHTSEARSNIELNELDPMIAGSEDPDVIAVSAGTNDFQYTYTAFGSIDLIKNGTYDNTTFYGAMAKLCDKLIANYPTKIIFFTTPIKRAQPFPGETALTNPFSQNGNGKTLGDYCEAIKEVCGLYSIPVLDLYNESLLNPSIAAQQSLFDGTYTHPNSTGMAIMARRVKGWMSQLI